MFCLFVRRIAFGCAQMLLLLNAAAAAPPNTNNFAVSAAQMQSLGVTLMPLEEPGSIDGTAYPARVVLPPNSEQVVSAPFAGRVDELLVFEQQSVTAGQPLLRLNSPEYGELQLQLLEAASKARLSQKTLRRERQLFDEGIIPERRVQEADAGAQEAAARLKYATAALRLAGVDAGSISKMADGKGLQDGLVLRARSAGVVLGLEVKAGARVQGSDVLVRLASLQQLWLDVQVPADRQTQALPKPAGNSITVVGRDVSATPMSVGPMVSDNQSVTLLARVVRGAKLLRVGEAVQVRVPSAQSAGGWALPLQAVVRQEGQAYVFLRTEKGFVAQPVTVVSSAGQSVQVTGDLRAGQQIATGSVIALKAAWLGKGGSN